MTKTRDIQAALDALRRYSERMARYKAYAPTEHGSDSFGDYLTIHDFIQSHAPAHVAVDLDAIKRDYKTDRTGMSYEQIEGWNDCIDHLAPRLARSEWHHPKLKDRTGRYIKAGQVVHWSDGGDDLPLEKRIESRWDRIAVVEIAPDIAFRVIDSPHDKTRTEGHTFHYGCFIYTDTENHLTIVADSEDEYRKKFKNAGECMAWVLSAAPQQKQEKE